MKAILSPFSAQVRRCECHCNVLHSMLNANILYNNIVSRILFFFHMCIDKLFSVLPQDFGIGGVFLRVSIALNTIVELTWYVSARHKGTAQPRMH